MSNFQFLESHWTDLAKLGDLSEKYAYSDPNTSIIKQGMLSEIMVKYMLAYDGIAEPAYDNTHANRIRILKNNDLLPREIDNTLYILRKARNDAAHNAADEGEKALNNLQLMYELCVWYMQTYASTISLGLLAMWQNKKQQEENDITQERMERIIIHANELSIISKMIEHEERRVNELDKLLNRFMQNCDPQAVAIAYSSDDKIVCMTQVTELERTIDKDFFAISRLLAEDKVLKVDPDNALKVAFAKLYQTVKKDIGDIRQEKIDMCDIHAVGKMAGKLSAERDTFMKEKEEYLESIQSKLRKLLFEKIALEDARKMYN